MRFYLDESGSTGDVAKVGQKLDFGGQPIFVLAAIGTSDEEALGTELRRLALRHGILGGELRSKNLVDKPELVADLAAYLLATDSPIFIEMMEKRYLIVVNLLNNLLLPPVGGFDEVESVMPMHKVIAEIMNETLPDTALMAYASACETTLIADLRAVFPLLEAWASEQARNGFGPVLEQIVDDSRISVEEAQEPDGHLQFLPPPDKSVTGRSISMLPGLSALTNAYARINKFRAGRLNGVRLIHDEHMLFGEIFREAKELMERLSDGNALPMVPNADYKLREHAELSFVSSSEPSIQAADVLAGFVMRFFRDAALGKRHTPETRTAMVHVMQLTDRASARGINMVAGNRLLRSAGFM